MESALPTTAEDSRIRATGSLASYDTDGDGHLNRLEVMVMGRKAEEANRRARFYFAFGLGVPALLICTIAILAACMYGVIEASKEVRSRAGGVLVDGDSNVARVTEAVATGVPLYWLPAMDAQQLASVEFVTVTVLSPQYNKSILQIFTPAARSWVDPTTVVLEDALGRKLVIQDGEARLVGVDGSSLSACAADVSCAAATVDGSEFDDLDDLALAALGRKGISLGSNGNTARRRLEITNIGDCKVDLDEGSWSSYKGCNNNIYRLSAASSKAKCESLCFVEAVRLVDGGSASFCCQFRADVNMCSLSAPDSSSSSSTFDGSKKRKKFTIAAIITSPSPPPATLSPSPPPPSPAPATLSPPPPTLAPPPFTTPSIPDPVAAAVFEAEAAMCASAAVGNIASACDSYWFSPPSLPPTPPSTPPLPRIGGLGTTCADVVDGVLNWSPDVTEVPFLALKSCLDLEVLNFPDTVTTISMGFVKSSTNLVSVTLPNTLGDIPRDGFKDCKSLSSIVIPDSVVPVRPFAFFGCSSLASVQLSSSVTLLATASFKGTASLTQISFPDSLASISDEAFMASGLQSLTIPPNVISIGPRAFANIPALTAVTFLGDAPPTFGVDAFASSNNIECYHRPPESTAAWPATLPGTIVSAC